MCNLWKGTLKVCASHRYILLQKSNRRGAWAAHSVERPTLDVGSGQDLMMASSPASGSVLTAWSLLGILSPSLSASSPLMLSLSLSLSQNK